MKGINTINDLVSFVANDLSPRVDKVGTWAKVASIGTCIGGVGTFGLFVLEFFKIWQM